jgi:hypothetical protein
VVSTVGVRAKATVTNCLMQMPAILTQNVGDDAYSILRLWPPSWVTFHSVTSSGFYMSVEQVFRISKKELEFEVLEVRIVDV